MVDEIKINVKFHQGAFVEIVGEKDKEYSDDYSYEVICLDNDTNKLIHSTSLKPNYWTKPNKMFFVNWRVVVLQNNIGVVHDEVMNLEGKDVMISIENVPLGDNIAWVPYCVEFQKIHKCNLIVQCFFPDLFRESYPHIQFEKVLAYSLGDPKFYATFKVAYGFDDDTIMDYARFIDKNRRTFNYYPYADLHNKNENKEHPSLIPLQKIGANALGMEFKELRPKLITNNKERPIEKKYVCISEFASGQLKMWNNQIGWQTVVDELKKRGFEVVSISKEKSSLKNIIKRNGPHSLLDRVWYLSHCEFFMGVSSALSWLAWGCGKKTVMISGITEKWNEYQTDNIRIINEDVCHGCWNSEKHCNKFAQFDRDFCPENKRWECSRKISPKMVIDEMVNHRLL